MNETIVALKKNLNEDQAIGRSAGEG